MLPHLLPQKGSALDPRRRLPAADVEQEVNRLELSGGIRQIAGGAGVISHIWTVESGPVPSKRGWYVSMNSDLGGAARSDFLVVANCERK